MRLHFQWSQILALRGGLSRHKVAVGEPAAGSPPFFYLSDHRARSSTVPTRYRAPPLQGGGFGFKSRRVHSWTLSIGRSPAWLGIETVETDIVDPYPVHEAMHNKN